MSLFFRAALVLMIVNGLWMAFDGTRALVAGDYVTPATGEYAGQLGPWAALLTAAGIEPRSTGVKATLALLGAAAVIVSILAWREPRRAWRSLPLVALLQIWYLPTGTIASVAVLAAAVARRRQAAERSPAGTG